MAYTQFYLFLCLLSLSVARRPSQPTEQTCGLASDVGVTTVTLHGSSPNGTIPVIHLQYDVQRKLPITSTIILNGLNLQENDSRSDNFRQLKCPILQDKQQNCAKAFGATAKQKAKNGGIYGSWDRGHLTPVSPLRFSSDAIDITFYCINIAPQEPWTNRCAWRGVEERVLSRTELYPSYVITGVCPDANTVDGTTDDGYIVPSCFWKLSCYVDPVTQDTTVVAWIGNNTMLTATALKQEKLLRKRTTLLVRGQQEILKLMGDNKHYIRTAWLAAANELTQGRNTTGLPDANTCIQTTTVSQTTIDEWAAFMKKHKPRFACIGDM